MIGNPDLIIATTPGTNGYTYERYRYQVDWSYDGVSYSLTVPSWLHIGSSGLISGTAANGTNDDFEISVRMTLTNGMIVWQNYTLTVERQPLTQDDAMAMAFGMLAFMMVISAIVGVVAMARRRS